jgi:hypothetical protein
MASKIEADNVIAHSSNIGLTVLYSGLAELEVSHSDDHIDYTLDND